MAKHQLHASKNSITINKSSQAFENDSSIALVQVEMSNGAGGITVGPSLPRPGLYPKSK
jgi:hypothetical protein